MRSLLLDSTMLLRKLRRANTPQPVTPGHNRRQFLGGFALGLGALGALGACGVDDEPAQRTTATTPTRSNVVAEIPVRCPW